MVLDADRESLHRRVERRLPRHRPALEYAVCLEPEVVVQPRGVVLLDHEDWLLVRLDPAGRRLGRLAEITLGAVLAQGRRHDRLPPGGWRSGKRTQSPT